TGMRERITLTAYQRPEQRIPRLPGRLHLRQRAPGEVAVERDPDGARAQLEGAEGRHAEAEVFPFRGRQDTGESVARRQKCLVPHGRSSTGSVDGYTGKTPADGWRGRG